MCHMQRCFRHTVKEASTGCVSVCFEWRSKPRVSSTAQEAPVIWTNLDHTGSQSRWATWRPPAQNPTTSVLTATVLVCAIGAGITAAAGTRLALQSILIDGFGCHPLQSPHAERMQSCYFSSLPRQCWHWAICAPAADLNRGSRLSGSLSGIEPSFPVPVKAVVVHYTTIKADRAECRPSQHQLGADVLSHRLACITTCCHHWRWFLSQPTVPSLHTSGFPSVC